MLDAFLRVKLVAFDARKASELPQRKRAAARSSRQHYLLLLLFVSATVSPNLNLDCNHGDRSNPTDGEFYSPGGPREGQRNSRQGG